MTPKEFWLQCEHEVDVTIGPMSAKLSKLLASIRDLVAELDKFSRSTSLQKINDHAGLQDLISSIEKCRARIAEVTDSMVRPELSGGAITGESDLKQMLDQLRSRLFVTLDALVKRLKDEVGHWQQETRRIKAHTEQEQVRLTKDAETLITKVKSVSDKILADAASEIKRAEARFAEERLVQESARLEVSKTSAPTKHAVTVSGAVGVLIGFLVLLKSTLLGCSILLVGIVATAFGIYSASRSRNSSSVPQQTTVSDGGKLRALVKNISEAAEQSVGPQVSAIKSELQLVKGSLDELAPKEKEKLIQSRNAVRSSLATLQTTDIDRAVKMMDVIKDICVKWEKLGQKAHDRVTSDWKRKVTERVVLLSSKDEDKSSAPIRSRISLGAAQFPAPAKVARIVGSAVISAPFWIDFADTAICLQPQSPSSQSIMCKVCTKLILDLAIASRGRLKLRIWDPRMLGAAYADLLTMTQFKEDFVYSGRALTTNRELDETLADLQKMTADRMAKLAKAKVSSWNEELSDTSASDSDFQLLLVVGFPDGFSEVTIKTLQSVATAGPRCGIFLLIEPLPFPEMEATREKLVSDAKKLVSGLQLISVQEGGLVRVQDQTISVPLTDTSLLERTKSVLQLAGHIPQSNPPEPQGDIVAGDITFEAFRELVAPDAGWKESSQDGLVVRLGTGFSDHIPQAMQFDDTTTHALLLGGTGSGKSNLLHSVIQGLAIDYSPIELSLYLADLKDGVEFSQYTLEARLPHAAAIAATADPRYAVALVRAAAEELTRRNKLFIAAQCSNFEKYRSIEYCTLPRILLVIDEFQVLFEDRESSIMVKTALINICKKGRSAGIHLLLASQSLKGKAGDIDEVLGLIKTRVLMQISEADARRAVSNSELAARAKAKCTRPGLGCIDTNLLCRTTRS